MWRKNNTQKIASKLDEILTQHRITPQAYHSRSFIGNHCHKYLQPKVYTHLTQTLVTQTKSCTRCPLLIDESHRIAMVFNTLNHTFSNVHKAISHTNPIPEDSVANIQSDINSYMTFFRHNFPNSTIPKMHILEHHCIPHIQQYKLGLGLLGEQGTESCH